MYNIHYLNSGFSISRSNSVNSAKIQKGNVNIYELFFLENLLEVVDTMMRSGDPLPRTRDALERVRPVRGLCVVVHVVAASAQRAVGRPARW